MPSSYIDSVAPIVKAIIGLSPQRVLDVGPGWGKYGLLCREYLPDLQALWAIEVPEGRLPTQDAIYDRVYTGDIRLFRSWPRWHEIDVVLMVDVIEHLPLNDGHSVLKAIQAAGCSVLVSTPQLFTEQHDDYNPHEEHLSLWTWEDFRPHGIIHDASTIDSIIYVLEHQ